MHILFVADPLESFKIHKDTSFSMMRELQRRGHRVSACEVTDIAWASGGHRLALLCGAALALNGESVA